MKKYIFILLLAIAGSGAIYCTNSSQVQNDAVNAQEGTIAKNIAAEPFNKLIKSKQDALILDVRRRTEFADGHIENSKNIDFYDAEFKTDLAKLDKNKPVLVYCRSGRRSGIAMETMREMGFKEIYNLQGGILGWQEAGYDIEK